LKEKIKKTSRVILKRGTDVPLFLYDMFSADEKLNIIPVTNRNLDNQWYGTDGGDDTNDNIFLLSLEENGSQCL
jgi:hypothetical protein